MLKFIEKRIEAAVREKRLGNRNERANVSENVWKRKEVSERESIATLQSAAAANLPLLFYERQAASIGKLQQDWIGAQELRKVSWLPFHVNSMGMGKCNGKDGKTVVDIETKSTKCSNIDDTLL